MPESLPRDAGVDSGTREASREVASLISTRLAPVLEPMPGRFSFKKIDSLLRGHAGIELAALLHTIPVRYCLVAPAYPYYSRVTRGGLQFGLSDGHWHQVGEHLHATLRSRGIESAHVRAGDSAPEGVSLWDAETDEDLQKVVEGRQGGGILRPLVRKRRPRLGARKRTGPRDREVRAARPRHLRIRPAGNPGPAWGVRRAGVSFSGTAPTPRAAAARLGAIGHLPRQLPDSPAHLASDGVLPDRGRHIQAFCLCRPPGDARGRRRRDAAGGLPAPGGGFAFGHRPGSCRGSPCPGWLADAGTESG